MRKPDYYKTPLRTRQEIMRFIINATNQRSYHQPHPLCFNVKCHHVNLDFNHLLTLWNEYESNPIYTHNEEWLKSATQRHAETNENILGEWARESACDLFTDSDAFRTLWNGTAIKVVYSFEGRSGGWLSVNSFEGCDFNEWHIEETLMDMDYSKLRKLYQLIVMLSHDTEDPSQELEHQAAFHFFANACADIPQPDTYQKRFEFAVTPA